MLVERKEKNKELILIVQIKYVLEVKNKINPYWQKIG
jgi:hypothetical protein